MDRRLMLDIHSTAMYSNGPIDTCPGGQATAGGEIPLLVSETPPCDRPRAPRVKLPAGRTTVPPAAPCRDPRIGLPHAGQNTHLFIRSALLPILPLSLSFCRYPCTHLHTLHVPPPQVLRLYYAPRETVRPLAVGCLRVGSMRLHPRG